MSWNNSYRTLFMPFMMLLVLEQSTFARYLTEDSEWVDREELLNSEYYNDVISYRLPLTWTESYRSSGQKLILSAGSLDGNDFFYREKIKLSAGDSSLGLLEYDKNKQEDQQEESFDYDQVSLGVQTSRFAFLILSDPGANKQFIDLGVALRVKSDEGYLELYQWHTDAIYESKKQFDTNTMIDSSVTTGLKFRNYSFLGAVLNGGFYAYTPVRWDRVSKGYFYYNEGRAIDLEAALIDGSDSLVFRIKARSKNELKRFTSPAVHSREIEHQSGRVEVASILKPSGRIDEIGLGVARRLTHETFSGDESEQLIETKGPDKILRFEPYFYASRLMQGSGSVSFQYGLFSNLVNLIETLDGVEDSTTPVEVKLQTAWNFQLSKTGSFFFNLTWDLDQVYNDYPFKESAFKPWGGGHVAFNLDF